MYEQFHKKMTFCDIHNASEMPRYWYDGNDYMKCLTAKNSKCSNYIIPYHYIL